MIKVFNLSTQKISWHKVGSDAIFCELMGKSKARAQKLFGKKNSKIDPGLSSFRFLTKCLRKQSF